MMTKIRELKINVDDKKILIQQSPSRLTMVEYQKHEGEHIQLSFDPSQLVDLTPETCGLSSQADLSDKTIRLRIYLHAKMHYRKVPLILKRA